MTNIGFAIIFVLLGIGFMTFAFFGIGNAFSVPGKFWGISMVIGILFAAIAGYCFIHSFEYGTGVTKKSG